MSRYKLLTQRRAAALLTALLVVGLIPPAVLSGPAAAQTDQQQCSPELTVTYDEFRTDQSLVDRVNSSERVEVTKQNTLAAVSQGNGFVRAALENPNSYCVGFEMQLAEEVVTPSTLGTVSAANSSLDATWEATHDFEADETYTTITVTLPADTTALFAPSKLRVESLSWTSEADQATDTLRDRLADGLNIGSKLESRNYELSGEAGEMLTVNLDDPNSSKTVENWHATYQLRDGDSGQTPLSEGSGSPVFYRSLTDENDKTTGIQITFNEAATVQFVAKPTVRDKIDYDVASFMASLRDTTDFGGIL